jgi:hypothetical protein
MVRSSVNNDSLEGILDTSTPCITLPPPSPPPEYDKLAAEIER